MIRSTVGNDFRLRWAGEFAIFCDEEPVEQDGDTGALQFPTLPGKEYLLVPSNEARQTEATGTDRISP